MTMEYSSPNAHEPVRSAPATKPVSHYLAVISQAVHSLVAHLKSRRQQRIDRQAFNTMLYLNDKILDDIGVTRDEVIRASKLPIDQNAAQELRKISQTRRRKL